MPIYTYPFGFGMSMALRRLPAPERGKARHGLP